MSRARRWAGLVLAVTVVATAPGALRGDENTGLNGDLKRLQGTWVAAEGDGSSEWTFDGRTVKTTLDSGDYTSTITLDEAARPHPAASFKITAAPDNDLVGQTALGIYKLSGDRLTLCLAHPGQADRPSEFRAIEGETFMVELKKKPK